MPRLSKNRSRRFSEVKLRGKTRIIFLLLSFWFLVHPGHSQPQDDIRVAINHNATSFSLKIKGPYEINDSATHKALYRGGGLKGTVSVYKDGIAIKGMFFALGNLIIRPSESGGFILNGRIYRGNLQLIRKGQGLLVVNQLGVEDYLKGILYHEVSHYWPDEALKAQAVASRTFALYQMQENSSREYDVTGDIYSQVYGGQTSERYRTSRAVAETQGEVVVYQGKIIPAYFHADCGGQTTDASQLWNINLAPLKGVRCDWCQRSPHFRWHAVFALDDIAKKLSEGGYKAGAIKGIVILDKDTSGRIGSLQLELDNRQIKIPAKDFRILMGPNCIKSTNFQVELINHDAVFEGFGWGHGAGLCQWGGYFMAKQGFNYRDILKYYYPQTELKAAY